ncbi:putative pentatricopeptide [Rosa chinensis]|uniref:Putative pentatricopeptide n=1 Tax=Rosa chinensis TaxID=74649 RepID=A0A2P6SAZ1_ROSCH|nr:putative pentatricopeptide [Rosa chinensis]
MALEGNGERALELFDDILNQGVKPDEVVFVAVLTACSNVGLLEHGRNISCQCSWSMAFSLILFITVAQSIY